MQKWEHKMVDGNPNAGYDHEILGKMGMEGWELVNVVGNYSPFVYFFKRPLN